MSDPNETYRLKDLSRRERHLDVPRSGNAIRDGYTFVSRKPRVHGLDECMSDERAKQIEGFYSSMEDMDYDD